MEKCTPKLRRIELYQSPFSQPKRYYKLHRFVDDISSEYAKHFVILVVLSCEKCDNIWTEQLQDYDSLVNKLKKL